MVRVVTRQPRLLSGVIALGVFVASSMTCLAASLQAPAAPPHACCASMERECGSAAAMTKDCCAAQQPGLTGLVSVVFNLIAPVEVTPVVVLVVSPPPVLPAFHPDASDPISPPPYLLDSVFRI